MKLKSILFILIMLFAGFSQANASQLPKEIKDYVISQKKVPTVRFDGILVYSDEVMYLPVYPAYPEQVDEVKIVKTYPINQTMSQLPDMVLFNNNFGLLKVIRTGKNSLTVRNIPDLPVEIKTGILPQDIMVPRGLVFPENLAGILGDVQIPLMGSAKTTTVVSTKRNAPLPSGKRIVSNKKYNLPSGMKNKLFFVNNFQTEYLQIFASGVSEPLYSLKTSGVMKDIKPVLDGKFLLAATSNLKNIDVIDVNNEYIAKRIDLTALPSEIAVDDANKKAYVASIKDESLSVIDLESMTMKEKIQLIGSPHRLSLSADGTKLAYVDMKTSGIYVLDLTDDYSNKLISTYPNTTKLILGNNVIYAIARTSPKLRVINFDLLQDVKVSKSKKQKKQEEAQAKEEKQNISELDEDVMLSDDMFEEVVEEETGNETTYSTSIKDINIGVKPVDMYLKNGKIFVLCAGNNTVYSYDYQNGSIKSEKLPVEGFSKAFAPVPNSDYAVVTNMSDLKYVVYDMNKEKAVETLPVSEYINMVTILERKHE